MMKLRVNPHHFELIHLLPSILKKYNGLGYTTYILPLEDQLEKDEEN